jgi:alpha-tubulin suppressor-like RCC1 family protein
MKRFAALVGIAVVAMMCSGCSLWSWGNNDLGQLGDGTTTPHSTPMQTGTFADWLSVSSGILTTCGIRSAHTLWCWGDGTDGLVGNGTTTTTEPTPVQVGTDTDWSSVSVGLSHACAIRNSGTLWCWGNDDFDQLGIGGDGTMNESSPVQIGTDTNWKQVAAGWEHTCGVRTNGLLSCWGDNSSNELGDGTTVSRDTPPDQIGDASTWTSVSTGSLSTCGIQSSGSLWCWGSDELDGIQHATPTQVGTDTNWRLVSLGTEHVCAVRTTGTLWCWGAGGAGQVGDGSGEDRTAPAQVGTATDWTSVSAGFTHSCGVRASTLWCWGSDQFGQLGDDADVNQLAPVQVGTATNWLSVSAGGLHTMGIQN